MSEKQYIYLHVSFIMKLFVSVRVLDINNHETNKNVLIYITITHFPFNYVVQLSCVYNYSIMV